MRQPPPSHFSPAFAPPPPPPPSNKKKKIWINLAKRVGGVNHCENKEMEKEVKTWRTMMSHLTEQLGKGWSQSASFAKVELVTSHLCRVSICEPGGGRRRRRDKRESRAGKPFQCGSNRKKIKLINRFCRCTFVLFHPKATFACPSARMHSHRMTLLPFFRHEMLDSSRCIPRPSFVAPTQNPGWFVAFHKTTSTSLPPLLPRRSTLSTTWLSDYNNVLVITNI